MFTVDMPPGLPIIAEGLEGISEAGGFARRGHVQRFWVTTGCPWNCLLKGSPFESIAYTIVASSFAMSARAIGFPLRRYQRWNSAFTSGKYWIARIAAW